MTEDERYLFDLNGFLIVRGVLTPDEVKEANQAIDRHRHNMIERKDAALRNAVKGTSFYGSGPGRKDLGGVLEWDIEDSRVFKSILAHPRLVPILHGILGKGVCLYVWKLYYLLYGRLCDLDASFVFASYFSG